MLHMVGNKGERGGEGTGPSDAQVMGPPRDGGDGELARGWPRRLPGSGQGLPCSHLPMVLPSWAALLITAHNGDRLLQVAPAEERKCGRDSKN